MVLFLYLLFFVFFLFINFCLILFMLVEATQKSSCIFSFVFAKSVQKIKRFLCNLIQFNFFFFFVCDCVPLNYVYVSFHFICRMRNSYRIAFNVLGFVFLPAINKIRPKIYCMEWDRSKDRSKDRWREREIKREEE